MPNSMATTLGDLADFALLHRKGKAFLNWTYGQILESLEDSLEQKALVVAFDTAGNIIGLCHGIVFADKKILYVSNILILPNCPGTIKIFLQYLHATFPGYAVEETRKGRLFTYKMERLERHVNNLT